MKVTFPDDPKIVEIFKGLPPAFEMEKSDGTVTVYCPIGYEISREFHNFKVREFYKIFKSFKVENGRKIWRHDKIVLENTKNRYVIMRVSPSELYLLKLAAKRAGETLSDYARAATITRMVRELGL